MPLLSETDYSEEYADYERQCALIRKENEQLLEGFGEWLDNQGLSDKTINKHVGNVDFFINIYLLRTDATPAAEGTYAIGGYLGYWGYTKGPWYGVSALKGNAASLKKFYLYLNKTGKLSDERYKELCEELREEMPQWLANFDHYERQLDSDDYDEDDMSFGEWLFDFFGE